MQKIIKYIISFLFFIVLGLIFLNLIVLPLIVNKSNNIYLPDYRGLDYRITQNKLDSVGFRTNLIFQKPNLQSKKV